MSWGKVWTTRTSISLQPVFCHILQCRSFISACQRHVSAKEKFPEVPRYTVEMLCSTAPYRKSTVWVYLLCAHVWGHLKLPIIRVLGTIGQPAMWHLQGPQGRGPLQVPSRKQNELLEATAQRPAPRVL